MCTLDSATRLPAELHEAQTSELRVSVGACFHENASQASFRACTSIASCDGLSRLCHVEINANFPNPTVSRNLLLPPLFHGMHHGLPLQNALKPMLRTDSMCVGAWLLCTAKISELVSTLQPHFYSRSFFISEASGRCLPSTRWVPTLQVR